MRRNLGTLLVVLLLTVLTAPPALAAAGDTWANTPSDGAGSIFDSGPPNKGTGDPFAAHPTSSIYSTYGYGYLEWKQVPPDPNLLQRLAGLGLFGLGGAAASKAPGAVNALSPKTWADNAVNAINTFGLMLLSMLLGLTSLILRLAYHPDWLNILTPFQRMAQQVFGRDLFLALEWVTLCASGIWLIARARKARFKEVAAEGSWVIFTVLLAFAAMAWPFTVAPMVDRAMTQGMGTINSQAAGFDPTGTKTASDGATAALHKALGYQTWCAGLIGRDASVKLANTYCPRLLKDSAFSYHEMAVTANDAGRRAALSSAKQADYKAAVNDLCNASVTACANVTGDKPWARFGTVALGYLGAFAALPFVLLSAGLLAYCLVLLRVGMAVLPLLILVGTFPPAKHVVIRVGEVMVVAFKSAILMGLACTGLIVAIGGILAPFRGNEVIVSYIVILLLTIAFWALFKPHRAVASAFGKVPKHRMTWKVPANDGEWVEPDYDTTSPAEAQKPSKLWAAGKAAAYGAATGGTAAAASAATFAAASARANVPAEVPVLTPTPRATKAIRPPVYVPPALPPATPPPVVKGEVLSVR